MFDLVMIVKKSSLKDLFDELEDVLANEKIALVVKEDKEFDDFFGFSKKEDVEIDLDDEQFLALAKGAHEQDITLNQFIEHILRKEIAKAGL